MIYLRTLSSMEKVPLSSGLHTSTVKMLVLTMPLLIPTRILKHDKIVHVRLIHSTQLWNGSDHEGLKG